MQFINLILDVNKINQVKQFIPYWVVMSLYFTLPFIVSPIAPPECFLVIDNQIPFVWWLVLPYYFHFIAIVIPPFLKWEEFEFNQLIQTLIVSTLICYLFFVVWPIGSGNIESPISSNPFQVLFKIIDLHWHKQNYFPSLLVVASGIIGLVIGSKFPKSKWMMWVYVGFIFFSTFLTKQHFLADSISGLIIAIIGWKYWLFRTQ